ncbi:glycosyltransferase [Arthrobacter sp. ISL-69]|uniref:glycosyltransferase n=1 Tax=Arthrobacter sp. ISL-69 TaxID=2819113 RepID=UPI001BEC1731|nr:glycosyltransferase [Arthrobacter sp. ISL-69]MBT2535312.1 glycosyltransferase [Arthrobacter sp. ISL-69]
MKILHVTDASSAGVLTSVTTLARAQSTSSLFSEVAFAYVRREDSPEQHEIQGLTGQHVSVHEWSSSSGPVRLVALTHHLVRALRSGRYDVIHFHSSRAGFLGRLVARLAGRSPDAVYSPHFFAFAQTGLSAPKRAAYLFLERAAAFCGDKLVVVSDSEGALARASLPGIAVAVLPNVVDNESLNDYTRMARTGSQGPRLSPAKQTYRVVHVGRIAEQKCPELFRAAIDALYERFPPGADVQIEVVWLGDGRRSLLGDRTQRIEVSGWLPREVLRERLAAADVVLFTSRGEGMPMALLEAQGLGIPVVASRVTGVCDVVEHGITGFLGTSPDELVGYVYRLLTDDRLRARMRQASQLRSTQLFDVGALAERSLAAYNSLKLGGGVTA